MDASRQTDDLAFAGPLRQAELVRAGEVTPRELVELCLARIGRLDDDLNAFRTVFAERALAEAEQAAGRLGAGDGRPLLGVPVAVKDDLHVAGEVRRFGTNAVDEPAPADAELVRRLRAAGAILIGITNVPELTAFGFTESATHGFTRNPWERQRTPGGSSGGSAAAVAAGLVALATASDGAGSIRIPAGCAGLFGLKPQRDRIPVAPLTNPWNGLSVLGFLTRSVLDSAFAYEAVTGEPWLAAARQEPRRLRIAVSTRLPPGVRAPLDASLRGALEETAELLRGLGHDVHEHDPDFARQDVRAFAARYLGGIAADAEQLAHPERLERRTKGFVRIGRPLRRAVPRANAQAQVARRRILSLFDDHDVLLTPMLAQPQAPVGTFEGRPGWYVLNGLSQRYPFGALWNHLGNPAASVPAGFTPEGLPLSVQLVGADDSEPLLLSLAAQLEQARPWADRRPPVA